MSGRPRPRPRSFASTSRWEDNDSRNSSRPSDEPPKFTIDLSRSPRKRYIHLVPKLRKQIREADLQGAFNNLLFTLMPGPLASIARFSAVVLLRGVYSREETQELTGISRAAHIPMHIMVAFNVLLDLLMGCSSMGVRTQESRYEDSLMLHCRTLDWWIDSLRHIIVELDFVRSKNGPVVATSMTYFGYVGVLTGVRKGLSMSLNFRPTHDRGSAHQRMGYRWHQLMVLLGYRQSISSMLRGCLLKKDKNLEELGQKRRGVLGFILKKLPSTPSTAAILTFVTPARAIIMEKDHRSGETRSSDKWAPAFNHDIADEYDKDVVNDAKHPETWEDLAIIDCHKAASVARKMQVDESSVWSHMDWEHKLPTLELAKELITADNGGVIAITNDQTHFAVIMCPTTGKIIWRRMYPAAEPGSRRAKASGPYRYDIGH